MKKRISALGLNQREFCEKHKVPQSTLSYLIRHAGIPSEYARSILINNLKFDESEIDEYCRPLLRQKMSLSEEQKSASSTGLDRAEKPERNVVVARDDWQVIVPVMPGDDLSELMAEIFLGIEKASRADPNYQDDGPGFG